MYKQVNCLAHHPVCFRVIVFVFAFHLSHLELDENFSTKVEKNTLVYELKQIDQGFEDAKVKTI